MVLLLASIVICFDCLRLRAFFAGWLFVLNCGNCWFVVWIFSAVLLFWFPVLGMGWVCIVVNSVVISFRCFSMCLFCVF